MMNLVSKNIQKVDQEAVNIKMNKLADKEE